MRTKKVPKHPNAATNSGDENTRDEAAERTLASPNAPNRLPEADYNKLFNRCGRFIATLRRDPELGQVLRANPSDFRGDLTRAIRSHLPVLRGAADGPANR